MKKDKSNHKNQMEETTNVLDSADIAGKNDEDINTDLYYEMYEDDRL